MAEGFGVRKLVTVGGASKRLTIKFRWLTILPSEKFPVVRQRIETRIIPDALYGIEYLIDGQKRYLFWALGCERTSPARRATVHAFSTTLKEAVYDALIREIRPLHEILLLPTPGS